MYKNNDFKVIIILYLLQVEQTDTYFPLMKRVDLKLSADLNILKQVRFHL